MVWQQLIKLWGHVEDGRCGVFSLLSILTLLNKKSAKRKWEGIQLPWTAFESLKANKHPCLVLLGERWGGVEGETGSLSITKTIASLNPYLSFFPACPPPQHFPFITVYTASLTAYLSFFSPLLHPAHSHHHSPSTTTHTHALPGSLYVCFQPAPSNLPLPTPNVLSIALHSLFHYTTASSTLFLVPLSVPNTRDDFGSALSKGSLGTTT